MHLFRLSAVLLVLSVSSVAAQVRDARPAGPEQPTGAGSISGTVTVAGTADPARRARLSLSAMPVNPTGPVVRVSRQTTTDENGRFAFLGLPAGRYTLSASKPGHVTVSYGQRQPGAGRPGTAIELGDGEQFVAHLGLPRGGVLTGVVLDEHGEATPGTPVRALRYTFQNGQRTLQQAGTASTDDRGIYRIYGLQPAEYVICAVPRPNARVAGDLERMRSELELLREIAGRTGAEQAQAAAERVRAVEMQIAAQPPEEEPRTGYAPVCYPGTTLPSAAVSVTLGVGQERSGVDFQLQLVSVGRVEGTVVSPAGGSPQNIQITLAPVGASLPGISTSSTRAGGDGRFRLNNVPPGQYRLTARGTLAAPRGATPPAPSGRGAGAAAPQRTSAARVWGMADISVDGRDVSDVVLVLQHGLSVSGRLAFEGSGTPPADLSRIRVNLSPVTNPGQAPPGIAANATADASGRFTITNVVPGLYRLSAAGAAGWTVRSGVLEGQDSLDFPVEVRPGANLTGAVVTFTDRQGEISGVITDGRGDPVSDYTLILFPSDSRYWIAGARRIQSTRPGTDGGFLFRNLPPGDYRIATVLDPEPGSWTDPDYLRELESASLRVPLTPGETKVQNIRLAGSR